MAILVSWLLCFIFTVTDVFPPDKDKYGFYARTDARQGILSVAPWFKIPYPCECVNEEEGGGGLQIVYMQWTDYRNIIWNFKVGIKHDDG